MHSSQTLSDVSVKKHELGYGRGSVNRRHRKCPNLRFPSRIGFVGGITSTMSRGRTGLADQTFDAFSLGKGSVARIIS